MTLEQLNKINESVAEIIKEKADSQEIIMLGYCLTIMSEFYISQSKSNKEFKTRIETLERKVDGLKHQVQALENNSSQYMLADIIDYNHSE